VGSQRFRLLPDVPALAEAGVDPGLRSYFGIFAPGGTPKPVVDRLNAEFNKALLAPRVQQFFRAQTLEIVGGTPEEFAQFLKEDRAAAGKVFQSIGVKQSDAPPS
jgi:tripartite-type tricarboxylate transporter receptor subunit TctC